ncbi:MAG TPA: urease accessory protein UreF [Stellaceae bacterium]|nr:urease accessory protein UreF [Stellaceae bacterium]
MAITTMMFDAAALYRLMTWLSPAYPLGAFSYSHGIEYAVEARLVHDAGSLAGWIETVLGAGAGRSDAALFAWAYRAAAAGNDARLDDIADLASAWRGSRETALESEAQGTAFLATTLAAWPHPALAPFARRRKSTALPVAVAVACAAHRVPLAASLAAYLHVFAANLVSAGIRLVPLGQTDGQRVIARLEQPIAATAEAALALPLEAVGTSTPIVDWCAMRHETQYTRLFRS